MSKIYEALKRAQREQKGLEGLEASLSQLPQTVTSESQGSDIEKEMINLYQHIAVLLPHLDNRMIQFIGSRAGEGTSTIVKEFAKVTSRRLNKKTLILNTDRDSTDEYLAYNIRVRYGWQDFLKDKEGIGIEEIIYRVGDSNLFLSPFSPRSGSVLQLLNSSRITALFQELRGRFDLVIVDSPPATVSPDGSALSRLLDGVVLIFEADGTRRQVAEKVKQQIIANGGNILGLIFNKRRSHVPGFIQRRL